MTSSDSLLLHLEALYQAVVQTVTNGSAVEWGELGQNAKGDQVKWFDLAADRAVCAYLEQYFPSPVQLLSEEGESRLFGRGEPEWIMILDPVDGSDNFSRGLVPVGTAIALIPAGQPIAVETVELALVGDLYRPQTWQAIRGQGAWRNGQPLQSSRTSQLEQAVINCDMTRGILQPALVEILARVRSVRSFGAATIALAGVADGSLDAYVDLRHRLTPENFLAPGLIISEAGGLVTGPQGETVPPVQALTDGYSVLVAANAELHAVLLHALESSQ